MARAGSGQATSYPCSDIGSEIAGLYQTRAPRGENARGVIRGGFLKIDRHRCGLLTFRFNSL